MKTPHANGRNPRITSSGAQICVDWDWYEYKQDQPAQHLTRKAFHDLIILCDSECSEPVYKKRRLQ